MASCPSPPGSRVCSQSQGNAAIYFSQLVPFGISAAEITDSFSGHQLENLRLLHLAAPPVSPSPGWSSVLSLFDSSGRSLRCDSITACKRFPGEKTAGY